MLQQTSVRLDQKFKADHVNRPIIIIKIIDEDKKESSKYEIILERFHSKAKEAEDFLIQVAEPCSITNNIQTFQINFYSLYTAMALKLTEQYIIKRLDELAKNDKIPEDIVNFIVKHTQYFNKAAFFLEGDRYYIDIETNLYQRIMLEGRNEEVSKLKRLLIFQKDYEYGLQDEELEYGLPHYDYIQEAKQHRKRFLIQDNDYFAVNQLLIEKFDVPVSSEYKLEDQDKMKDNVKFDRYKLRPIVKLFEHQNRAIAKIFKDDVARSGVIILPCGAGKTLLGITVALKVKKRTLIICDSVNSIIQWKDQFLHFTFMEENQIIMIMSSQGQSKEIQTKVLEKQNIIVIITQDMLQSERPDIKHLRSLCWNCCIIDEVHGLPAKQVSKAFSLLKVNIKIGLTATPFRQDNKIREIFYQVGPKLHESMIVDLTTLGFVSKIYCIQVQIGMEKKYKDHFDTHDSQSNQQITNTLYQLNPKKYEIVQHLIDLHRSRKDKILIFCEKINKLSKTGTLSEFAIFNKCPIILQDVDQRERQAIYRKFRDDELDVIIFGQIADQGLDLPSANVGIQISFNFNSVRQEFQRMGRIQRKKENVFGSYDCFFYTLVSKNTNEVKIQFERQLSVINQGYPYEVLSEEDLQIDPNTRMKIKKILQKMEDKIIELNREKKFTGSDND